MFAIILQRMKVILNYFPMDFKIFTPDDELLGAGAITSAVSKADLKKIKLLSNEAIIDTGPAPTF